MRPQFAVLYSPREIACAAGVTEREVRALIGDASRKAVYIAHDEAVRLGRVLAGRARDSQTGAPEPMFAAVTGRAMSRKPLLPLALSSSLHGAFALVLVFIASFNLAPRAAALRVD